MLAESVGSALLISKLQGGKLRNLYNANLSKWGYFVGAGLLEASASIIRAREIAPLWTYLDNYVVLVQAVSYGLVLTGLYHNRKSKGFYWLIIGVLLNFMVIMANGGKMPVDIAGFDPEIYKTNLEALASGKELTHGILNESTRLWFLGDIIHFRRPYPLPKSLSIGDFAMMAGVFIYLRQIILGKANRY